MSLVFAGLPPLALYIHVPWCVKKCPYCDFNSHTQKQALPEKEYIDALLEDLTEQLPSVWGRPIVSIFIGGGTPSLFTAQSYDYLLSQLRALLPFSHDIEITLEANPGTAEADKFKGYFDAGINRMSIGVQSFNLDHLKVLGRIHNADEALRAVQFAKAAGFEKINIDLMHGLPKQTPEQAENDLKTALDIGATHVSWYQLTLEPNTPFYHSPPAIPDDDHLADIQELGEAFLTNHGFDKYEISAYASTKQQQSVHNKNYWSFGDYLAIGAGAHGKITLPAEQKIIRFSQYKNPKDYLNKEKPFNQNRKAINVNELPLEFMMNALRLKHGVPAQLFSERTGLPLSVISSMLNDAKQKELLVNQNNIIAPTELGQRYLNDLLDYFLPEKYSALSKATLLENSIKITKL